MAQHPALPIRMLVKGASTVNWTSFMGGPRQDLAFPRVAEQRLLADGRPAIIHASTMPSQEARSLMSTWQQEVLGFSPDVIALLYGHYEAVHYVLPRWVERHANSLRARPTLLSNTYRRVLLKPLWKLLVRGQQTLDRLGPTHVRRRHRKVVAQVRRYIEHVQRVGSPLVLVFEFIPTQGSMATWFPGSPERTMRMNQELAAMVEDIGLPNVRYFTVRELVDEHFGGDQLAAQRDGFHYTPEMHRRVGEKLGAEASAWAATQSHLNDA